ncbi:MAG: hypothetical protein J6Q19_04790 [Bacteroidaceae bacterium]|nr:hypothetical protein [Bacteroidaceae bacterium]
MTAVEALNQSKGVLNGYIKCTYVQLWQAAKGRFIFSMQRRFAGINKPIVTMTSEQYARRDGKYVPVTLTDYALNNILAKIGLMTTLTNAGSSASTSADKPLTMDAWNKHKGIGKAAKRGAITQGYQTLALAANSKTASNGGAAWMKEVWVLESAIAWQPQEKISIVNFTNPDDIVTKHEGDGYANADVNKEKNDPEIISPTPSAKKTTTKKKDNKKLLALILAASSLMFN